MLERDRYERATRVGQAVISVFNPGLAVDGNWGEFTQRAYGRLVPEARLAVDSALTALAVSASELAEYREKEKKSLEKLRSDYTGSVDDALRAAAAEIGVSEKLLRAFAVIESNLNPKAANGSSRGLMQMQPAAWADAMKVNPTLRPYSEVFDPLQNARAGAVYLKINMRRMSKIKGFDEAPDAAQLYLAHQQGAAGFAELWNASKGVKTTDYVSAKAMTGNPPPDKRGVTTDKAEFYNRWIAHVRRKVAAL